MTDKKRGAGGRPTKYKPAYCNEVIETLGEGYSLAVFAGDIGVCRDTVHEWANQHQEFSDAIKIGRAKGARVWEKRLANLASKGEGNATVVIFGLKNRLPDDWKDVNRTELTGKDGEALTIQPINYAGNANN